MQGNGTLGKSSGPEKMVSYLTKMHGTTSFCPQVFPALIFSRAFSWRRAIGVGLHLYSASGSAHDVCSK